VKRAPAQWPAALAAMLLAAGAGVTGAQQAPAPPQEPVIAQTADAGTSAAADSNREQKKPTEKDRRRAAKLFLQGSKLFEKEQFDAALRDYDTAVELDPANTDYAVAAQVARSHAVTDLIQVAAKARLRGDFSAERTSLQRAGELDPKNLQVSEHLHEMADEALAGQSRPLYEQAASTMGEPPTLSPTPETHSFHTRSDRRQLIQTMFKAYGIEATLDQSVSSGLLKLDIDDATFAQALQVINMTTGTFFVTLDPHRVLVAKDTVLNRQQFMPQEMETVYLGGLQTSELTDIGNLAKNVFQIQQVSVSPSAGTITLRASANLLNVFNASMRQLLDGRSQVLLEVRLIQLAHTNERNTGAQLPQQITAFNVYAEEQSILNANQALVQEIISSGLAAPGDTLAILGILLASGQVSSSLFQNGIALFGGGLTLSGISPGPAKLNLNLNSSDTRELDQMQIHLGDGEEGTLKNGLRYPITTSSYSNLGATGLNIPGLTTAGNSGGLSALLASFSSTAATVPQIEYQDLGLTLKATPRVIRSGEVALTMDMKITALAGSSLNGVPVINNRSYSGVVTLKDGSGVVIVSQVDKQESRALSGIPGLSEIPGLNNVSDKDTSRDYATLVIIVTPHVIRGTQAAGQSPMMRVERGRQAP
jgi:general secretion pathway protein D